MKAVIVTGGKQYTVAEGDVIYVEKLGVEAENTVTFDKVLAVVDGENSKFGKPMVAGATVEGKVIKNGKGKKIVVFKYQRIFPLQAMTIPSMPSAEPESQPFPIHRSGLERWQQN